jgi:hypothetical protein
MPSSVACVACGHLRGAQTLFSHPVDAKRECERIKAAGETGRPAAILRTKIASRWRYHFPAARRIASSSAPRIQRRKAARRMRGRFVRACLCRQAAERVDRRGQKLPHGERALAARVPQELREQLGVAQEGFVSETFHTRSLPRRSIGLVTHGGARIAPAMTSSCQPALPSTRSPARRGYAGLIEAEIARRGLLRGGRWSEAARARCRGR